MELLTPYPVVFENNMYYYLFFIFGDTSFFVKESIHDKQNSP